MQPARVRLLVPGGQSGYRHDSPTSSLFRVPQGCGDSFITSPDPAARVLVPEPCCIYLNGDACNSWANSCHRRLALAFGRGGQPYLSHHLPTCPRIFLHPTSFTFHPPPPSHLLLPHSDHFFLFIFFGGAGAFLAHPTPFTLFLHPPSPRPSFLASLALCLLI